MCGVLAGSTSLAVPPGLVVPAEFVVPAGIIVPAELVVPAEFIGFLTFDGNAGFCSVEFVGSLVDRAIRCLWAAVIRAFWLGFDARMGVVVTRLSVRCRSRCVVFSLTAF